MLTVADTAFAIAAVRAEELEHEPTERLFEDPFAKHFAAAGVHAAEGTARYLSLPFFKDGVRLRTRFIDDAVRDGLAADLDQIVLLGAGFDARGLRMKEIAERAATVHELDAPAQIARKRDIMRSAGIIVPPWLRLVAFDFDAPEFERRFADALAAEGFRVGERAIFVWEGVIGYIDDAAIERSLRAMAEAGGPGSRLVYTAHEGAFGAETAAARFRRLGFRASEEHGLDYVWRKYWPTQPYEYAGVSKVGIAFV